MVQASTWNDDYQVAGKDALVNEHDWQIMAIAGGSLRNDERVGGRKALNVKAGWFISFLARTLAGAVQAVVTDALDTFAA